MKQLLLDISSLPSPSFENFVPGKNIELLQLLKEVGENKSEERFIYIWGDQGSGKTHLLKALIAMVTQYGTNACYVRCEEAGKLELGRGGSACDLLAIDDVNNLNTESAIKLFNLYNEFRDDRGVMVVSANDMPKKLKLRNDLMTRFSWGLVYPLHGLTDAEKLEALMRHARARGFNLSSEVATYLLRHVRRDFPNLVATLDALDRFSLESKRPITVPLIREVMRTEEIH